MKQINLLIQPTHACNLKCKYCYDKNNSKDSDGRLIRIEDLKKIMDLISQNSEKVACVWLGGEPTIFGVENFKEIFNYQLKLQSENNCLFRNSMESNGLFFDVSQYKELKKYDISIGISFDGKRNELSRNIKADKMISLIKKFKEEQITTSCVYVLNKHNYNSLIDDYYLFKSIGVNIKINPCICDDNFTNDLSIPVDDYIEKMFELFKTYYEDENRTIHIDPFDEYILMITQNKASSCHFGSCLYKYICIDSYGDIYPCGRFHKKITNIKEVNSLNDIFNAKAYNELLELKKKKIEECSDCELFYYCGSGCLYTNRKNNSSCLEFKKLFSLIKEYLEGKNV